jgi:predicted DCC family thiol-disulfide oxidoreductase YuxK
MTIVYDGLCPFCTSYVQLMALRQRVGTVDLVDARSDHPSVSHLKRSGYDLNEGMAAIFGGKVFYGSDALALISRITDSRGPVGGLISWLLRDPARARTLYPAMKRGRKLALKLLGRPQIA